MTSRGFILGIVVAAMGNFGCKSELAMPGGVNSIGGGTTLTPLTNAASASDIRSGKKVYDSDGNVLTGILATQSLEPNSTAVPAGYYSVTSLDSVDSDLVSSNIKSGVTIFGVSGSSSVVDTSTANATDSDLLDGKTAYVNGVLRTGNILTRTLSQNSTAVPAGYYSVTSLDSVDSDLVSSNIKSGVTIFGVTGTSAAGDFISSMAPRKDNATVDLSNVAVLNRSVATISQEVSGAAAFTNNHNLVPDPQRDNDGRYAVTGGTNTRHHYLSTLVGRPTTTCGTVGSIENRIADCSNLNGNRAFYDGRNYGQNGEGDWKLVTLTAAGNEVWRDERTKLIWSDRLSTTYNWCQAAGYAKTTSTLGFLTFECGAGLGGLQPSPPVSACADEAALESSSFNGISNYSTPDESAAKGNLGYSSNPNIAWRLPTIHDWMLAEINGARKVLPNLSHTFWSATSYTSSGSSIVTNSWTFNGDSGLTSFAAQNNSVLYRLRCVGE